MAKYLIGNIKGPKGDRGEAGPTYTAGTGIDITNNVISATNSGGITTETDPVFSASPAANITTQNISDWNAKSDFSGDYNDLTNKPDLTVYATTTALGTGLARKQDTLTAGDNITIENNVISATGGGGGSSDVFVLNSQSTTNPDLVELLKNNNPPKFIQDLKTISHTVYSLSTVTSAGVTTWFRYMVPSGSTSTEKLIINFNTSSNTIVSLNTSTDTSIPNTVALKTDLPKADGTTIINNNGTWSAVGGGSAEDELPTIASGDAGKVLTVNSGETGVEWTTPSGGGGSDVFLLTSTSTNNPELLALIAAGKAPKFIQLYSYGPVYSLWTDASNVYGTEKWLNYRYQSTPTEQLHLNIKVDNPVTQIMQIGTPSETLNGNFITVDAGGYGSLIPSISGYGNNLVGYFRSIGTNFAQKTEIPTAQANAATALYLKDSNNQVYEITVDINGTLTATAVSNS